MTDIRDQKYLEVGISKSGERAVLVRSVAFGARAKKKKSTHQSRAEQKGVPPRPSSNPANDSDLDLVNCLPEIGPLAVLYVPTYGTTAGSPVRPSHLQLCVCCDMSGPGPCSEAPTPFVPRLF